MRSHVALALAIVAAAASVAAASGPGLPDEPFPPEDVFTIVGSITTAAPYNLHGSAALHDGYLVVPISTFGTGGGFSFYDISDPRSPVLVGEALDPDAIEGHSIGFSSSYPGKYAATRGAFGVQFWDWTDVANPALLSSLVLPGVQPSDYDNGVWWIFWQAPYVYAGCTSQGLYVVDAADPANPVVLNRVPITETGGFRIGSVTAIGNLLVLSGNDVPGVATLDIGDPVHPRLIAVDTTYLQYSTFVNGGRVFGAGTGADTGLLVWDLSDPAAIVPAGRTPLPDRAGYASYQDGFLHVGGSFAGYFKLDVRGTAPFPIAGSTDFAESTADVDFVSVLGHVVVMSDDDGNGTRLVPHRSEPDATPPRVTMVVPKPGAAGEPATTRVGLTFSDRIDLASVGDTTLLVRPLGGGGALPGKYSEQMGIVNFSPDEPLLPETTYEVIVPAGGIRDAAGNATDEDFVSIFTTGADAPVFECAITASSPSLVGETVAFGVGSCSDARPLTYSWNFGDGSPATPFSPDPGASHAFERSGRFTVLLTADDGVARHRFAAAQRVIHPPTPTPPARSSPIAFDAASDRVFVANGDALTVTAIDASRLVRVFEAPVAGRPESVAPAPDGTVWVACRDDAAIRVLDAETGAVVATIPLERASRPRGLAMSPAGDAAYVALEATGRLSRLDPVSRAVTGTLDVGPSPRGLAVTHDGARILVTRFISPAGHGEVVEVDAASFTVAATHSLRADPGPDGEASGRGVPNYLFSVSISPDGRRAFVPSKKDNTGRGLFLSGEPLTFQTTVRAIVSQIDLAGDVGPGEVEAARRDLDNRSLPNAVAFSAMGEYAFVATYGSNTVEVLDAATGVTLTALEDVGQAPEGLATNADGSRLFVRNALSRDVAVYDVADPSEPGTLVRLATVASATRELLPERVLAGKRLFANAADDRMSRDNYLACASCHFEGDTDGRVWDFTDRGEGLRSTPVLEGKGGLREGPLHWSANFDELQDFEGDIRSAFGGEGFMSDADFFAGSRSEPLGARKVGLSRALDDLSTYVASLARVGESPFRAPDGSFTPEALAGKTLFESAAVGCAECHSGSELTASSLFTRPFPLHDVGTLSPGSGNRLGLPLEGLDTPTLKGVWATAPYLHDGSAATLRDVLTTRNPLDLHGRTSHLSASELDALVAYLEELGDPDRNGAAPGRAADPSPADRADRVCPPTLVSWTAAPGASGYDVWFGNAAGLRFRGNQPGTTFDPGALASGTTYFWRVDPTNGAARTTGEIWRFTVRPDVRIFEVERGVAATFSAGSRYYSDRPYTIESLPASLEGAPGIRTANADKDATAIPWTAFTIDAAADVFVAYDPRATARPDWMSGFTDTGEAVGLSESEQGTARLYRKRFGAGRVALGGNLAPGASGALGNYFVLVRAACGPEPEAEPVRRAR